MRTCLTFLLVTLLISSALAQDPATQATQIAIQQSQIAAQAAQQAAQSSPPVYFCSVAVPKFSVKPGRYSSPLTVRIRDNSRGAVIYYTTDGWTPTVASPRYLGPVSITSTTTLQAIAVAPCGGRSRVLSGEYILNGVPPTPTHSASTSTSPLPSPTGTSKMPANGEGKFLLARGTPVTLIFASGVNSKTADVGDKIPLVLANDVKADNITLIKKGAPAIATVTEVDKPGMAGAPGAIYFQIDSLQAGSTSVKLQGGAAKEGQDKADKAIGLMFIPVVPVGLFVHGQQAEIKQGASITAVVDTNVSLPPAL